MIFRIFLFLLGFGLTTIGLMYIICYLNLISIGYNFLEYGKFIISRIECLNAIIGIILMIIAINIGGKYELYI